MPAMNMGLSSQETMSSLELRLKRKRERRVERFVLIQNLEDSYNIYQCLTDRNDFSL